jgi:hypothetical protein
MKRREGNKRGFYWSCWASYCRDKKAFARFGTDHVEFGLNRNVREVAGFEPGSFDRKEKD